VSRCASRDNGVWPEGDAGARRTSGGVTAEQSRSALCFFACRYAIPKTRVYTWRCWPCPLALAACRWRWSRSPASGRRRCSWGSCGAGWLAYWVQQQDRSPRSRAIKWRTPLAFCSPGRWYARPRWGSTLRRAIQGGFASPPWLGSWPAGGLASPSGC